MLGEITPREMDEVVAFERLEPDPLWRIAEILKRGFTAMACSSEIQPDDFEPESLRKEETEPCLSPDQQVQMLRGMVPGID
jgi:hypothetical protein